RRADEHDAALLDRSERCRRWHAERETDGACAAVERRRELGLEDVGDRRSRRRLQAELGVVGGEARTRGVEVAGRRRGLRREQVDAEARRRRTHARGRFGDLLRPEIRSADEAETPGLADGGDERRRVAAARHGGLQDRMFAVEQSCDGRGHARSFQGATGRVPRYTPIAASRKPASLSAVKSSPSSAKPSTAVTGGIRKNNCATRFAAPRRSSTNSRAKPPIELIATSQARLATSALLPSKRKPSPIANGSIARAATACCTARPRRISIALACRFWYSVPRLMPTSPSSSSTYAPALAWPKPSRSASTSSTPASPSASPSHWRAPTRSPNQGASAAVTSGIAPITSAATPTSAPHCTPT